jgi:hypothetical protein
MPRSVRPDVDIKLTIRMNRTGTNKMSSYLQACKNCRFRKATRATLTDIGDCGLPLVLGLLALHPDEGFPLLRAETLTLKESFGSAAKIALLKRVSVEVEIDMLYRYYNFGVIIMEFAPSEMRSNAIVGSWTLRCKFPDRTLLQIVAISDTIVQFRCGCRQALEASLQSPCYVPCAPSSPTLSPSISRPSTSSSPRSANSSSPSLSTKSN